MKYISWKHSSSSKFPLITKKQEEEITPFFIITCGRSGSTLLRTILCRHEKVSIPPETNDILPKAIIAYHKSENKWEEKTKGVIKVFEEDPSFKFWKVNLVDLHQNLVKIPAGERSLARIVKEIYIFYGRKRDGVEDPVWGDKTPYLNFRLPYLRTLFPNAKYIFIIRDGRDVVSSYLRSKLIQDPIKVAERWKDSLKEIRNHKKKRQNWLEIRYETLVKCPALVTGEIMKFLGLTFNSELLQKEKESDLGDTVLSHHENTKKAIFTDSIGKWKNSLSKEEQRRTMDFLQKSLEEAGYLKS